jgi:putative ABC transport system substrate-binding protein
MQSGQLRRRKFITLLGGAAAWPLAARAQQGGRVPRLGVLHSQAENDAQSQARVTTLRQALQQLGWSEGRDLQIEYRWSAGNAAKTRKYAMEIAALAPDVILTGGAAPLAELLQATRTVPIVFVLVADPVGAGFVNGLARPGGNATGFTALEYGFGVKWLELLKEIDPDVIRVAVVRDPSISVGIGLFGAIQSAAPSARVEVSPIGARDAGEIEQSITTFARTANGGLIVTASPSVFVHRNLIVTLAERHRLPAVYPGPEFVSAGGLIGYGPDILDQYRRAADYIDRILKGVKSADLPVQNPTKYQLVINMKTAKALGIEVPPTLLVRADEIIE